MSLSVKIMRKKYLFFVVFIMTLQNSIAQNSTSTSNKKYIITASLEKVDDFFIQSFEKANWDRYRYEDERRELKFENGIVVELLSANELVDLGVSFDMSKVVPKGVKSTSNTVFAINENGHIIEKHTYNIKK